MASLSPGITDENGPPTSGTQIGGSGIMPKTEFGWTAGACSVCTMDDEHLLALNLLLADPKQWPKTTFQGIRLPQGALPPGYRLWGAMKTAANWLEEQGITVNRKALQMHYTRHVTQVPASALDFAGTGMLSENDSELGKELIAATPTDFRQYYAKGISLGLDAIDLLQERIQLIQAEGGEVPLDLLLKTADLGHKLATSAATLTVRGMEMDREREDEIAGFRAGNQPLPSRRMGHHRVRVIEGEARPVVDEGRSDRRRYNESAKESGNPTLPA